MMKLFNIKTSLFLAGIVFLAFSCRNKATEQPAADAVADDHIRLSDAQVQLANISTCEVRRGIISQKFSLTGVLKVDEQSIVTVSSRVTGRIEKLYFRNTGETVSRGDKLYELYSEELVNAQREYYTLQSNNWNFSGKYEPSLILEDKLRVLGLMPEQIKQLGKDGKIHFTVTIYSPAAGKIRSVNVTEGQYITEGETMFELADNSKLWIEAQVYPDEIRYLRTGMPAIATVPITGDLPVKCMISFINPSYEQGRNVTLVRAEISNKGNRLYPGMLAVLDVQAKASRGLIIPAASVIEGAEDNRVWIKNEDGDFSCRIIRTGLQAGDSVQVLEGLTDADIVVTTGAYLLNSELILRQGSSFTSPQEGMLENKEIAEIH